MGDASPARRRTNICQDLWVSPVPHCSVGSVPDVPFGSQTSRRSAADRDQASSFRAHGTFLHLSACHATSTSTVADSASGAPKTTMGGTVPSPISTTSPWSNWITTRLPLTRSQPPFTMSRLSCWPRTTTRASYWISIALQWAGSHPAGTSPWPYANYKRSGTPSNRRRYARSTHWSTSPRSPTRKQQRGNTNPHWAQVCVPMPPTCYHLCRAFSGGAICHTVSL